MTEAPHSRRTSRLLPVLAVAFPIVFALGVMGVMVWQAATFRGYTEGEDALYARVKDIEHPAIDRVWQEGDTEHTVFFVLKDSATDSDARDVWCDIVGVDAIRQQVGVGVQSGSREWVPPARCSDPDDVPEAL